jgi:hypothetical protein
MMPIKARENMSRAWLDVTRDVGNPDFTMANVTFTAGFLAGGEKYHAAALVIALAEKVYGPHRELFSIKHSLGISDA